MVNFKEYVTRQIGLEMEKKAGDHWRAKYGTHTHICKELKHNFLDGKIPKYCDVKGHECEGKKIHYHRWSKCLTSSQVMCITFFKKFFEEDENLLLELLRQCKLNVASNLQIENAMFEYEPDSDERTNFDFYLVLANGQRISFEVKYTEQEFGGISNAKEAQKRYSDKWNKIYKKMVEDCPYFTDEKHRQQDNFYRHYQISRNIVHATRQDDIVVFLTPRENQKLDIERSYIEGFKNDNIVNLYWEEILTILEGMIEERQELKTYYRKFRDKYFWFID